VSLSVIKKTEISTIPYGFCHIVRKAEAPCSAPTGKCSSARKVRLLTFIAEGYLTRAVTIIALSSHDCYKILKED
jgi:hypothetical protein